MFRRPTKPLGMEKPIDYDRLRAAVMRRFSDEPEGIHGPPHWARVERNGLCIAAKNGADLDVVRLFSLFHDSMRMNDGWDPGHGARGAALAKDLRGVCFELCDARFDLLIHACTWHTDEQFNGEPTIGTCFDADRLDLGRVGILPSPDFMSTEAGREIAKAGSICRYL